MPLLPVALTMLPLMVTYSTAKMPVPLPLATTAPVQYDCP